jgi:RNA polymerase sigma-70 factor (ECF subfamily)
MNRDDSSPSVADLAMLGKLFEEHRPRLLAMLGRRLDPALGVRVDPDDILNEAYLVARKRWSRFRQQADLTPYAWLYGIARDCLIEAWRKHTRGRRDLHKDLPWPQRSSIQLGLSLIQPGTSPSEAIQRDELQQQMRQTLDLLKSDDQEILWMRHYDDLSFKEAAAVLGITENAATVRYVRALRRLKDLWLRRRGRVPSADGAIHGHVLRVGHAFGNGTLALHTDGRTIKFVRAAIAPKVSGARWKCVAAQPVRDGVAVFPEHRRRP